MVISNKMQISNNTHFSSDAYLISKKQYEADHKSEIESKEIQSDISTQKLEEKTYSKSINAMQPLQVVTEPQSTANNNENNSNNVAVEKALTSYNAVENSHSSQGYFNQVKEMV